MKVVWRRPSLSRISIALALGMVATAIMTYGPLNAAHRGRGATIRTIHRGHHGWWHARDAVFGVRWSNLMLIDPPLSSPIWEGEMHGWEEPPPPPYPEVAFLRIGTLAAGWPLPTVSMRWTVTSTDQSFPVAAELDDLDTSIAYAVESVRTGRRGGAPHEVRLLWPGILFNIAFYAALVIGPGQLFVRWFRGYLTRREASAAAR
jgi:hypothetical protein